MSHSSPVNAELLADRLQRVIDSFDAQRQKYHNNASDPGFNGMQQEAWASLANEKADDLRVLRKLLVQSGIRAQCVPDRETLIHTICPHIKVWSDADDVPDKTCQQCPATVQTSHGEGVQMCRLNAQRAADAILSAFTSPEHQSAPAYAAAHNSGEGDPSVMPDYAGADTAIQPQCVRAALQTIKDICAGDRVPNWKDDWQTTHSRGRILDLCDAALSHTRPECGDRS